MESLGIDEPQAVPSGGPSVCTLSRQFSSRASQPLTAALSQQMAFEEAPTTPEALGRQLTQQLTRLLNSGAACEYTDESPRGEEHSPLVYYLGARLLRGGLFTQAAALALQIVMFLCYGGNGWFNANIFAAPDVLKGAPVYVHLSALLEVAFLVGVVQVAAFQVLVADSSKWTVGFRSGSKLLGCAVSLDLASATLRVASSLHFCRFVSARWLGRNMQMSGEWALSYLGSTLQGLSLLSYGFAFAALELYHDRGTKAGYAYALLCLFPLAGAAKLSSVYLSATSLSPLLLLLALVVAQRWSEKFEPLLERWSPELHTRRLDENILPNPRRRHANGSPEETPKEGEAYTYAAVPAPGDAADAASTSFGTAPNSSRMQLGSMASFRPSQSGFGDLPTTYDYDVLQQQIRSHAEEQRQQQL